MCSTLPAVTTTTVISKATVASVPRLIRHQSSFSFFRGDIEIEKQMGWSGAKWPFLKYNGKHKRCRRPFKVRGKLLAKIMLTFWLNSAEKKGRYGKVERRCWWAFTGRWVCEHAGICTFPCSSVSVSLPLLMGLRFPSLPCYPSWAKQDVTGTICGPCYFYFQFSIPFFSLYFCQSGGVCD